MKKLKHFSELSKDDVVILWQRCCTTAIEWAKERQMSGFSEGESHNLYTALHDAIFREWESSKAQRGNK